MVTEVRASNVTGGKGNSVAVVVHKDEGHEVVCEKQQVGGNGGRYRGGIVVYGAEILCRMQKLWTRVVNSVSESR